MMTTVNEYRVTGMTCGHCEAAVRGEVSKLGGVEQVEVSAANGRLVIASARPLSDDDVLAAVDEAGYAAARV
jgi:copper chaperone